MLKKINVINAILAEYSAYQVRQIHGLIQRWRRGGGGARLPSQHSMLGPQGGGGTLIFSAYVGSDPASSFHPKKISGILSTPKKYLKF